MSFNSLNYLNDEAETSLNNEKSKNQYDEYEMNELYKIKTEETFNNRTSSEKTFSNRTSAWIDHEMFSYTNFFSFQSNVAIK